MIATRFAFAGFAVPDIEVAVGALVAAGIEPVRYNGFDQDARGISRGIARNEGPDIAWITDPAGNIISVLQNPPEDIVA